MLPKRKLAHGGSGPHWIRSISPGSAITRNVLPICSRVRHSWPRALGIRVFSRAAFAASS